MQSAVAATMVKCSRRAQAVIVSRYALLVLVAECLKQRQE
jgi:hypothetical protein